MNPADFDPRRIELGRIQPPAQPKPAPQRGGPGSFAEILNREVAGRVQLSNHARDRLAQRNINLDAESMQRVGNAIDKVQAKGGRSSLILLDGLALVTNVPDRRVVTAIETSQAKEQVFTNIDSVVFA
jgi:flagellar operon protein